MLTMTAGLDWHDTDADFNAIYRSQDWAAYMLGRRLLQPPGSAWNYCSACWHLLTAILQEQTGDAAGFAKKYLFEPLGI